MVYALLKVSKLKDIDEYKKCIDILELSLGLFEELERDLAIPFPMTKRDKYVSLIATYTEIIRTIEIDVWGRPHWIHKELAEAEPGKDGSVIQRRRGRPKGSKNKPKMEAA